MKIIFILSFTAIHSAGVQMFTVSEVARKIRRPDETVKQAVTRVRNWTKEGLLKPHGKAKPGTGRARKYSNVAMLEAVLMQALVNSGFSATRSSVLIRQMAETSALDDRNESVLLLGRDDAESKVHMQLCAPHE